MKSMRVASAKVAIVATIATSLLVGHPAFAQSAEETPTPADSQSPAPAPKAKKPVSEPSETKKPKSEIADIIDRLEYPELQVVPRASERLKIEAKEEDTTWFVTHWPTQISGLATVYTALQGKSQLRKSNSDEMNADAAQVSMVTMAVGASWFVAGIAIGAQRPYRSGVSLISKYEGKSDRLTLMRERLAEEQLEAPARLMKALAWASVLTNLGMNAAMGFYMSDEGRMQAGVGMALAFLPIIFEDHNIRVYEKHLEYKKKIYGPIAGSGVHIDPRSGHLTPVARLAWSF